jgi:hypothetical protein
MNAFTSTADSIVDRFIRPGVPLLQQPLHIKILLVFIILLFIFGLAFNCYSMFIFFEPVIESIGGGKYFIALTIINLIGVIMFRLSCFLSAL